MEATTGRLYLLTDDMIAARRASLGRRIDQAEREAEELDALIEIGGRVLLAATDREAETADTLRRLLANDAAGAADTAAARAARAESVTDLSEQRDAQRRRRARRDEVADELRDLRRERLRLDLAAQRRQRAEGAQS
ncbi:hypothetical protein amb1505 [Paramagnetospirillum magneticum AMB-1]|uniref:Uncharacterized protein n=2 Tax=Paramagnetospirillum magneticum TaxID=84159 RepID=Q2W767_PARM1|nr:hypothetical protein amb1505 [Paramagnetospirillum magneticum AMB-1]